jgi:hypothetical protein
MERSPRKKPTDSQRRNRQEDAPKNPTTSDPNQIGKMAIGTPEDACRGCPSGQLIVTVSLTIPPDRKVTALSRRPNARKEPRYEPGKILKA